MPSVTAFKDCIQNVLLLHAHRRKQNVNKQNAKNNQEPVFIIFVFIVPCSLNICLELRNLLLLNENCDFKAAGVQNNDVNE